GAPVHLRGKSSQSATLCIWPKTPVCLRKGRSRARRRPRGRLGDQMGKILATHVGSLIRPPELLSFLAAGERGESYDEAAYAEVLRGAVQDVVNRQIDVGIDIVDDG